MTANIANAKLNSFFSQGFFSGTYLQELKELTEEEGIFSIATSNDEVLRNQVSINCICDLQGIEISLFHSAKGGFTVMLEEKKGDKGLLDAAIQCLNEQTLRALELKLLSEIESLQAPELLKEIAKKNIPQKARDSLLSQDKKFSESVSERTHRTALFIFKNIEILENENLADDGCQETGRKRINPDCIECVLLSQRLREEITGTNHKIVYVTSTQKNYFTFSYEDSKNTPRTFTLDNEIEIPDFEQYLINLAKNRDLRQNPIYTHMTRLFI